MKSSIQEVQEFHEVFNHPIAPAPVIPPMDRVMFRINFLREELDELEAAAKAGDLVEMADGMGDMQYVLDGFYLEAGLHQLKGAISSEIHRSNMSKACTSEQHAIDTLNSLKAAGVDCYYEKVQDKYIVYRTDGKAMKALGYSKPDLAKIIEGFVSDSEPMEIEEGFSLFHDLFHYFRQEHNIQLFNTEISDVLSILQKHRIIRIVEPQEED